jgi:hypothetical protein
MTKTKTKTKTQTNLVAKNDTEFLKGTFVIVLLVCLQ